MRTPHFKCRLVISAILIAVSWGIAQEFCLASTINVPDHTLLTQAGYFLPKSSDTDEHLTESPSVSNIDFSYSVSPISHEQPVSGDPDTNKQWALGQIQASRLWQITTGDHDILIAILDTGIDKNHEDLNGKVVVEVNFTDSPTPDDVHGHGTHIAGIVAATSNNGKGIIGLVPESRLMNVKVADDKGKCQASVVAKGITWAVDNGASVINISLEIRESSFELEGAIEYAWSRGVLIIAAAGNDGSELPIYPAYYEKSIAVAATRQNDKLAPLSNYGDWVDVAAPGSDIYSTLPSDSYGYKSGTSFATAYVSSMAALLFDIVTDTNGDGRLNDEVRAAIEAGCQEIGTSGVGRGRIDAAKSLDETGYAP